MGHLASFKMLHNDSTLEFKEEQRPVLLVAQSTKLEGSLEIGRVFLRGNL